MAKQLRIYILLGGFMPGPDGYVTSAGMYGLRSQIEAAFPDAVVQTYQWSSFVAAAQDVAAHPDALHIVVGYSGGGSRATWLAQQFPKVTIDLIVLYDPSPRWQMLPIGANVKSAITYENSAPFFFGLGAGVLTSTKGGPAIERVPVAENHMVVQTDQSLHDRTIAAIKLLAA